MNLRRLMETLKRHEGSKRDKNGRHIPYMDTTGHETLGYGRNLTDRGISDIEANYLLAGDMMEVIQQARRFPWFSSLTAARQEVVVNMIFNLGITTFKDFKNTIRYIAAGDYDNAAKNMLKSKWATQVGYRAVELAEIMRTGEI